MYFNEDENLAAENGSSTIEDEISKDEIDPKLEKKKAKGKLLKLELQVKELQEKLLRNEAELQNFKKRIIEESIKDRIYATSKLIADLITPLDMLKTVVNIEQTEPLLNNYLMGFKMITNQIFDILEKDGLKEIETFEKPFDPKYHHAVEKIVDKQQPNGAITEVTQKGYLYKEKVLKPAMVKINEWSE